MFNAAVHIPLSSGDLRKRRVIVKRRFYRKVYITDNDELLSVLGAGKDPEKGYFMIVSFKE